MKLVIAGATSAFLIISVFATESATSREEEPYCDWDDGLTEERLDESDSWLFRDDDPRIGAALAEHLPFGYPDGNGASADGEILLAQPHFIIWYDTDLRAPIWTAHHLTRYEAKVSPKKNQTSDQTDAEKRKDSFRSDPRLTPEKRADCRDYKEPIFDRGHMVPNSDLDFMTPGMPNSLGMDHSFLMSNMTPQHCAFNRGPWQVLEGLVRDWAGQSDDTWIVTGAVFDRDGTPGRDADGAAWKMAGVDGTRRVAIPSAMYKIIARWSDSKWQTLTVYIENTDNLIDKEHVEDYLTSSVRSLEYVRQETGLRFLASYNVEEAHALWAVKGKWPGQLTSRCEPHYPDK